jgi:ABC-type transport system involved in multi-copper enzyme maturation permease subunit
VNPVFAAERRYQGYVIRTNRSSNFSIALALLLLIPALIMALFSFFAVAFFGVDLPIVPIFNEIQTTADSLYTIGAVTLFTMNLAHYLVVALISSGLAIFSVQREYRNHTWDLLVLTRVSAWQIASGKIGASLWVLRRDIAIVTVLRIGLVAFVLDFVRPAYPVAAGTGTADILIVTTFVIVWTVLDMMLSVATATASALIPQGRVILMPLTFAARAVTTFGGVIWIGRVIHLLYAMPDGLDYVVTGLIGITVFAALAIGSLKIAEFSAQLAHASPHKISQPITQTRPPVQGQGMPNIPSLSQS